MCSTTGVGRQIGVAGAMYSTTGDGHNTAGAGAMYSTTGATSEDRRTTAGAGAMYSTTDANRETGVELLVLAQCIPFRLRLEPKWPRSVFVDVVGFGTRFSAHVSVHTRLIQPCSSLTTNVQVAGRREVQLPESLRHIPLLATVELHSFLHIWTARTTGMDTLSKNCTCGISTVFSRCLAIGTRHHKCRVEQRNGLEPKWLRSVVVVVVVFVVCVVCVVCWCVC